MIDLAREALGSADANSTEFDMFTEHPVIDFMPDQRDLEDKGGTMRLGLYPARLEPGSKAMAVYGSEVIYERHRHRFEVNNRYRAMLEQAGMILSGQSPDSRLVEIVELRDHPFMVGAHRRVVGSAAAGATGARAARARPAAGSDPPVHPRPGGARRTR